jgi:hypothetical protein
MEVRLKISMFPIPSQPICIFVSDDETKLADSKPRLLGDLADDLKIEHQLETRINQSQRIKKNIARHVKLTFRFSKGARRLYMKILFTVDPTVAVSCCVFPSNIAKRAFDDVFDEGSWEKESVEVIRQG